jgi:hypothetical protein
MRRIVKKLLLVSSSARLSACMEQLGSHWKDFHEMQYLIIFLKYVEKIQVSLTYDENNEYFKWRPIYAYDHTSLSS